jgi:hypothetical protein
MGRIAGALGTVVAASAVALALHSALIAPHRLRIRRRAVVVPRLPATFHDFKVLHLTDLHIGALASGAEHVLAATQLRPDLIAITGDLVERGGYAPVCAELLARLHAPCGVLCVMGNHDNRATYRDDDAPPLAELLPRVGVQVLQNQAVPVERGDDQLWVVGVDDPHRGRDDLELALASVPAHAAVLLLAHSPEVMRRPGSHRADLVLAGHYHGGQVRTPWGPLFTRADPRLGDVRGLQRIDGTPVHMSAGLGSTIPFRLLCPPEMTMLHLVRPAPLSPGTPAPV